MIKTKKDLKDTLAYEKKRYGKIPKMWYLFSALNINEMSIIWKYQRRLRIWEYHLNNKHRIRSNLLQIKTRSLGRKYGLSMSPNIFDRGLKIMHLGSILINNRSSVGKNCVLHINTALVSTNGEDKAPILGDDCILGIGSVLIGNIVLGNEVVVGAGSIVTRSFEENHITIAGVPAKIISRNAILWGPV